MAIYHLSTQIIKRSAGRSSVAAAAYRAAEKLKDVRAGILHDYTRKKGVDESVIYLPTSAPREYENRETLWNAVEQKENRKDAQLSREIDVAIPCGLSHPEMKQLVSHYVKQQFVNEGMIADVCYHDLDSGNPHCHIMLTMRHVDADGFRQKNRKWNDKTKLQQWREAWTYHANTALENSGSRSRIDHRTLKEQGINREPEKHLGPAVHQMVKRGQVPDRAVSTVLKRLRERLKVVQEEIKRLMTANRNGRGVRQGMTAQFTHEPKTS